MSKSHSEASGNWVAYCHGVLEIPIEISSFPLINFLDVYMQYFIDIYCFSSKYQLTKRMLQVNSSSICSLD